MSFAFSRHYLDPACLANAKAPTHHITYKSIEEIAANLPSQSMSNNLNIAAHTKTVPLTGSINNKQAQDTGAKTSWFGKLFAQIGNNLRPGIFSSVTGYWNSIFKAWH